MWDLKACRCCLSTKDKLERATDTIRRTYAALSGLEFTSGDGYPTYFCVECHSQLKKSLAFRRKSRRAYYVLHRFMTSKKQITLNDIMTVNRRRNNLISSIGNSKLSSMVCYKICEEEKLENDDSSKPQTAQEFYSEFLSNEKVIKTEEMDSKEDVVKPSELEKYEPARNGFVYQTVVIKSSEQLEEERMKLERILEDSTDGVSYDVEFAEPPKPEPIKIDMDDVFKDLVEENRNSDESDTEQNLAQPKTKKEIKDQKNKRKIALQIEKEKENRANRVAKALPHCDLRPQSEEEQLVNWKKRMNSDPYKSARVKCCICLITFDQVESLMEHVKFHNKVSSNPESILCEICKGKFASAEEHEKHFFDAHLYLYECKLCKQVQYDLDDFSNHYYMVHNPPKTITRAPPPTQQDLEALYRVDNLPTDERDVDVSRLLPWTCRCEQCHINLSNTYSLTRHMKTHDLDQMPAGGVVCDHCRCWFSSKNALTAHMERWHLYRYSCRMCSERLYCRDDALKHRSKHTFKGQLDGQVECEYCHITTTTRSLHFHIFTNHYTEKYHLHCVTCGKSTSTELSFYKHQLQEHGKIIVPSLKIGEPDFVCKHCDVQFLSQDAYYTHLLKHRHPEAADIPNSCTLCRVRFESEEEYRLHERRCKNNSYPRDCVYCSVLLTSTADSVKHYMTVHKDMDYHRLGPASKCKRYLLCETCGASVKSSKIALHRKVHEEGLLQCSLCDGLQFTTARQVVLHVLKCHCDKPFICMICQNKFKQRSQCRDHILKTHAPVRPYKCPSCPLKFSHKDYLNEHNFKIHEVPIPGRGPRKKLRGVCTTYPHMQVDVSLVPENVISDVQFRICDYHDKNLTNLRDHTRFFITTRREETKPVPLTEVHLEDIKRKFKEELENAKKKFKTEELIIEEDLVTAEEIITSETDLCATEIECIEDVKVVSVPDYQDFEEVEEELVEEDQIKLDGEDTYEVVEAENGERFVVIDGVMYKIEQDMEGC